MTEAITLTLGRMTRGLRATAVTRGWNEYRSNSQRKTLTQEKKNLPQLLLGIRTHDLLITSPAFLPLSYIQACAAGRMQKLLLVHSMQQVDSALRR